MKITEVVHAYGHVLINSTHKTTLMITKDGTLTKRGDCIVAVKADKGAADLSNDFKAYAKRSDAVIALTIHKEGIEEIVKARGDPRLSFTKPRDIVVRKSNFVCGRTIAIGADKAACDLSRRLIEDLRNPRQRVKITFVVEAPHLKEA